MAALTTESAHARRSSVQRRLMPFLVLVAILFGSLAAPALAHPGSAGFMHTGEIIDVHEYEASADKASDAATASKTDPASKERGGSSAATVHHHCACSTTVDDTAPATSAQFVAELHIAATHAAMTSIRSAPPTEPPSA